MKLLWLVASLWFATTCLHADTFVTKEGEEKAKRERVISAYIIESHGPPTVERVIKTLNDLPADGPYNEALAALEIVQMAVLNTPELQKVVIQTFDKNHYWLIKVKCAVALLTVQPSKGEELSRALCLQEDFSLEGKLILSSYLISSGRLFAFPVFQAGMRSTNKYLQNIARGQLVKYAKFEGKNWNAEGDRIITSNLIQK